MDVLNLQAFIFEKLHQQLPGWLNYHNTKHTEEVIKYSIELSKNEELSNEERILLQTAAIMHDTGFISIYVNHEIRSCEMACEYLPGYGYTNQQIEHVCEMIMATKLPQTPKDKLAEILCDADLYYLGTDRYRQYADHLFGELKHQNENITDDDWLRIQNDFLNVHHYFTKTAKQKLNLKKQLNQELYVSSQIEKNI